MNRRIRLVAVAALLVAGAAVLLLLATDTLRARTAFRTGETVFAGAPGDASWTASGALGSLGRSAVIAEQRVDRRRIGDEPAVVGRVGFGRREVDPVCAHRAQLRHRLCEERLERMCALSRVRDQRNDRVGMRIG